MHCCQPLNLDVHQHITRQMFWHSHTVLARRGFRRGRLTAGSFCTPIVRILGRHECYEQSTNVLFAHALLGRKDALPTACQPGCTIASQQHSQAQMWAHRQSDVHCRQSDVHCLVTCIAIDWSSCCILASIHAYKCTNSMPCSSQHTLLGISVAFVQLVNFQANQQPASLTVFDNSLWLTV